jgi:hypothetical protein
MVGVVVAPDGKQWTVRRVWAHRTSAVRWRGVDRAVDAADALTPLAWLEDLHPILAVPAMVAFLVLLLAATAAVLLVLVDVLVLATLVVTGAVLRVAFRRPWRIEATPNDGRTLAWHVTGYGNSRRTMRDIEIALRDGCPLPPPHSPGRR